MNSNTGERANSDGARLQSVQGIHFILQSTVTLTQTTGKGQQMPSVCGQRYSASAAFE
ncbi:hypothetical protein GCM10009413_12860 [Tatumella punctata]